MRETLFALYIPGVHSGGTDFVFLSGTWPFRSASLTQVPHAITSVGRMASTLDLVEPIVDSSPFSIDLALDATSTNGMTVRDIFSRDPIEIGSLASDYLPTSTSVQIACSASLSSQHVCIGTSVYYYTHSSYSSGIDTGTLATHVIFSQGTAQGGYQYYDSTLKIGPKVTKYPARWKGLWAYLYVWNSLFASSWKLYRAGYIADNPSFSLSGLTISFAPLDCKLRDHDISTTSSRPAHFPAGDLSRNYLTGITPAKPHIIGQGFISRGTSIPVTIADDGTIALTSGSYAYSMIYQSLQPVLTTPSGACMYQLHGTEFATPLRPPFFWSPSINYSEPMILGRTGTTAKVQPSSTLTAKSSSIETLPTWRWMLASPSGVTNRCGVIATRNNTRTSSPSTAATAEPLAQMTIGSTGANVPVQTMQVRVNYTATSTPAQNWFGLYWEETCEEPQVASLGVLSSFNDRLRTAYGMPYYAISCADSTLGWHDLVDASDCYSVKLVAPEEIIDAPESYVRGTHRNDDGTGYAVGDAYVLCRLGMSPTNYGTVYTLASATAWWLRGEDYIALDRLITPSGKKTWFTATWTEDPEGAVTHERQLRLSYDSNPATGVYLYKVVKAPRHCPGIGDWFGRQAVFLPDQRISGDTDGDLFAAYLLGDDAMQGSLWLYGGHVDVSSLYYFPLQNLVIREWIFADAKTFDENFASLLAMSSSAMSFDFSGGDYRICRVATGRADKALTSSAMTLTDDVILTIPTASRDENVISDYGITLPEPYGTVTYHDAVVSQTYSSTSSIEVDLSECDITNIESQTDAVRLMAGPLANMVSILGYDRRQWSFDIPFEVGWSLTPGALVRLTTRYTVGADVTPPPSGQLCRVLDVDQDPVGQVTSLRIIPVAGDGARYQRGCVVEAWDATNKWYTVDDGSWITVGMTLYAPGSQSVTVSSISGNTFYVGTFVYTSCFWRAAESDRFLLASDALS